MTSQVESYSGQNKQSFASLFSDYTLGRYCSDPSLDINSSRRLELDILFAYLIKNSSSSWLYKINDEVTGYLGMRKSDWDTNFWGFNFATIDHFYYHSHDPKEREKALNQLLEASNEWCASEQIAFASARADANDLDVIRALENHGFRYIETTVINSYDIKSRGKQLEGEGKIRLAYEHELPQLVSMVDDAFTTHRFYADQKFSKEKADQMYREWVESSINSGDWETIVMEAEGKVRGFFVYRIEDMSEYFQLKFGKWRLAALGLQDRGSGYGTQLFSGAMNFIQDRVDIIDSGLTVRNTRSFNLHNKLGFKIQNFSVTMHKWFE